MSDNRITDLSTTAEDVAMTLSGGNPGAIRVLAEWFNTSPLALIEVLILDSKRLYDHHIWNLYKMCGYDIERFKYHVAVELPNQETGILSVTGPHAPRLHDKEFWQKRTYGQPGAFWALENPPLETHYEYPIK